MVPQSQAADRREAAPKGAPDGLLARYFRDVAALPLLQPEQELSMAATIEFAERDGRSRSVGSSTSSLVSAWKRTRVCRARS